MTKSNNIGNEKIKFQLIDTDGIIKLIKKDRIELLKFDIAGAEYEVLISESFMSKAPRIKILCIEFHHRWNEFGVDSTIAAVEILNIMGFECVWRAYESNEEFTFINKNFPYALFF